MMVFKDTATKYNGGLTSEQFLFYEIRIVARLHAQGKTSDEIIDCVKKDNLFQYPTERKVSRLARACHRRLIALKNETLIYELANAPTGVAKQINLYTIMCRSRLVREFMINLIGEKYRLRDYSFQRKDINMFFFRLQEQNDDVAGWRETTIVKLKQVLIKCLVETEMLNNVRDETLNPILISEELEAGIYENNDLDALSAFNSFKGKREHDGRR
jgi:hypothetical protein